MDSRSKIVIDEDTSLLPAKARLSTTTYIAIAVAMVNVFGQIAFQVAIPHITEGMSDRLALSIAVGIPAVAEHIGDLLWIPVTNDIDRVFHSRLLFAPLSSKQRDALRKCDSLDQVVRICILKLPAILFSMIQAYQQAVGINWALLCALGMIMGNAATRLIFDQAKAIEENWVTTVKRNDSFNYLSAEDYMESQARLNKSRAKRGLADKSRSILWAVCLLVAFCFSGDGPSIAVYGKIVKDAYSLDGFCDKLFKSWIPARTLLRAYRGEFDE